MSEQLDRIEAYVSGQMTSEEVLRFESEMSSDEALRIQVERARLIDSALETAIEDDLRERLRQMDKENKPQHKARLTSLYRRVSIAASVLIVIGIGLWYLIGSGGNELDAFVEKQYLPYDHMRVRGEYADQRDFPFPENEPKSEETAMWLEKWIDTHPADYEARFFHADVLKKLGRLQEAREEFAALIDEQSILWSEKAAWNFLLLSAETEWDARSARVLGTIVEDPGHSYHSQAIQLEQLLQ